MNDVVVRLVGGLGNQMFQYAAARAIALRCDVPLVLDLSWFSTVDDRHFALSPFKIEASILSMVTSSPAWRRVWNSAAGRLSANFRTRRFGRPLFVEKSFHYDADVQKLHPPVFLDGYFQTPKYFEDFAGIIAEEFRLTDPPRPKTLNLLASIESSNAICIHVRRGDYITSAVTNTFHGVCSMDYYRRGLEIVAADLAQPQCFVFSDDPAWVRENLRLDLPMTIVDIHGPAEAHDDLRLMAACHSFVIANSSLSWWGAWLGHRDGKRVVAPAQWFGPDNKNDTRDLIPSGWIRV